MPDARSGSTSRAPDGPPLDERRRPTERPAGAASDRTCWQSHADVLDGLAANIRRAESLGWSSCAIERRDGADRFTAWGVPPGESRRHPVPARRPSDP